MHREVQERSAYKTELRYISVVQCVSPRNYLAHESTPSVSDCELVEDVAGHYALLLEKSSNRSLFLSFGTALPFSQSHTVA